MKKLLFILLFLFSGASITFSQNYLTIGQVYNFNVGDVFETQMGSSEGGPPTYGLTIVLNKWYSTHSDTVYYEDSLVNYTPPSCMSCTGSFNSAKNIVYYTKLSDSAGQSTGSYCPQTWDTIYTDSNAPYCGEKVWEIGPTNACLDSSAELLSGFNVYSWVVEGCGGPYYDLHGFDWFNDIPYTDYYHLIYYKRNDTICGYKQVITGINQPKPIAIDLKIYPNPSNGIFTLAFDHPELISGSQTIEVSNILGQSVYSGMLK
ncbi:MAG TPA: hypothetical protein VK808_13290, partial [Bacteroidia bacterium]|nr:hypothetical protein [Bacteroidia bacterium]